MHPAPLATGDRVIVLAAVTRSAATLSGAITATVLTRLAKQDLVVSFAALLAGALGGFCVGMGLGNLLFPAASGRVMIARVGTDALPLALKASLSGALSAAILAALIVIVISSSKERSILFGGTALAMGLGIALLTGYFASQ